MTARVFFVMGKKLGIVRDYSARSASMGLSWAALYAGNSPKTTPIATEQPNERTTEEVVM
ncbi:MAG: hypothetical protein WA194_09615 [Patescibacteria group bacterium]